MNWKTWIPLTLAIVLGLVAAKVARDMMAKNKQGEPTNANLASVVVLKRTVPPGTQLSADDLTTGQVAIESKPEGAFTTATELVGRVSAVQLNKGQAVMEPLLAPGGSGSGLAAIVPPGMRAITIEVNEFSGLAGMVTPGCMVDVLACVQGDGDTEMLSRTIVQNIKVLAVGQRMSPGRPESRDGQPEPFRSVTLLASTEESEAIDLAASTSRPRLVMRSGLDVEKTTSEGITVADLRGGKASNSGRVDPWESTPVVNTNPTTQPTSVFERVQSRTIKIIRAGQESSVNIPVPSAPGEVSTSDHSEINK